MRNPDLFPTSWHFVRAENETIVSHYLSITYSDFREGMRP